MIYYLLSPGKIRFTICPKLLANILFTEVLGRRESLVVTGVEQLSICGGYNDNLRLPWLEEWRKRTSVVAMDAIKFNNRGEELIMKISTER